jgi:hypothetical protein
MVFQPEDWRELISPVIALHTFLHVIIIFLLGWLVWIRTKNTKAAILISTLWTLLPYILYFFYSFDSDNTESIRYIYTSHLMGFPMLSESLSTLVVLLGFCLFYYKKTDLFTALAGAVIGFGILVRTQNAILPCVIAGILIYKMQIRRLFVFAISVFILALPQLLIYVISFGNVFGYSAATEQHALFSLNNFLGGIKFSVPVIIPLLCAVMLNKKNELAIITLAYVLFVSSWWAFKSFPLRLLIPIIPIYLTAILTIGIGKMNCNE